MASLNDDIEKYLKGELTPSEMHAMEQKALNDPFLAEALEGAGHASGHFALDVQLLQRSIKEKTAVRLERRRIAPNGWHLYMGIAAGLLILAVSSFIVLTLMRQQQENKDLAYTKSGDTVNAVAPTPPLATSEKKESNADSASEQSIASAERPIERVQNQQPTSRRQFEVEAKLSEAPVITKSNARTDSISHVNPVNGFVMPAERIVKGRIVSADDGSDLAGVNVLIRGTNKGTISDTKGNFEIAIPANADGLVFSFIGLESAEVPVKTNAPLVVRMKSDASQLTEIMVTGQEFDLQGDDLEFPFMEMAEPKGGRTAFKDYLTEQMQYPYQALDNKVEGGVTIQFTVLPTGQLVDFKIVDGLGYGCDEEVIRLVKEGPSWAPTRLGDQPVKEDVRIRLMFDIPEKK
jgi:TonB family protein